MPFANSQVHAEMCPVPDCSWITPYPELDRAAIRQILPDGVAFTVATGWIVGDSDGADVPGPDREREVCVQRRLA